MQHKVFNLYRHNAGPLCGGSFQCCDVPPEPLATRCNVGICGAPVKAVLDMLDRHALGFALVALIWRHPAAVFAYE